MGHLGLGMVWALELLRVLDVASSGLSVWVCEAWVCSKFKGGGGLRVKA